MKNKYTKSNDWQEAAQLATTGGELINAGRYEQAIKKLEIALEKARRFNFDQIEALCVTNLGVAYLRLEKFNEACQFFKQAASKYKDLNDDWNYGNANGNWGICLLGLKQYDAAEKHLNIALKISQKLQDNEGVLLWERNLLNIQLKNKDKSSAAESFLKNIEAARKCGLKQLEALILGDLSVFFMKHDESKARKAIFEHLKVATDIMDKRGQQLAYQRLGILMNRQGQYEEAKHWFLQGKKLIEKEIDSFSLSWAREQLFTRHTYLDLYQNLAEVSIKLEEYENAFEYAEKAKAQRLAEIFSQRNLEFTDEVPNNLIKEYRELVQRKIYLEKKLTPDRLILKEKEIEYKEAEQELKTIKSNFDKVVSKIQDYKPDFNKIYLPQPPTIKQLHEELPHTKRTALIEFFITKHQVITFIIVGKNVLPEGEEYFEAFVNPNLSQQEIKDFYQKWDKAYQARYPKENVIEKDKIENWHQVIKDVASLGEELLNPLIPVLEGCQIEQVIIIPHQELHVLPIHIAKINNESQMFCDKYSVGFAPSAFIFYQAQKKKRAVTDDLLVVCHSGSPDEPMLENVEQELKLISEAANVRKKLVEKEATPQNVIRLAKDVNTIHFACHGIFEKEDVEQSGLKLEGSDRQKRRLTLKTILREMDAEHIQLVVLSACETGVAKLDFGDENIGLIWAFLQSGAKNVIATLWPVDDLATLYLMKKFYQFVSKGNTYHEALKKAQQELRNWEMKDIITFRNERPIKNSIRGSKMNHPISEKNNWYDDYYIYNKPEFWASFIINGAFTG